MKIAVLGAHSAIAKAFSECLEEREIEVDLALLTTSDHLEGELELVDEAQLRAADLVVLAFGGEVARGLAKAAMTLGRPVLDLAEALAEEKRADWIFPGVDPDAGSAFDPTKY